MQLNSPIGEIIKNGHTDWSYDMLGYPLFWMTKAKELDRMVLLGFIEFKSDIEQIRSYTVEQRLNPSNDIPYPDIFKPTTLSVSFFLAALAIENLLKGILMSKHPEYIENGKFRGKIISSHNLIDIAIDANITLTADEEDFCELGTEAIMNFGRYHMGKNMSASPTNTVIKGSAFRDSENIKISFIFTKLLRMVSSYYF